MAQNLRGKMPKNHTLLICELDKPRRDKFVAETEGLINVVEFPREIAELSVSSLYSHIFLSSSD